MDVPGPKDLVVKVAGSKVQPFTTYKSEYGFWVYGSTMVVSQANAADRQYILSPIILVPQSSHLVLKQVFSSWSFWA